MDTKLTPEQRVLQSSKFLPTLTAAGRPLTELGLMAQGSVTRGHMVLMDVETLEVFQAEDGVKINEDRVFVNTRNLPRDLLQFDERTAPRLYNDPEDVPDATPPVPTSVVTTGGGPVHDSLPPDDKTNTQSSEDARIAASKAAFPDPPGEPIPADQRPEVPDNMPHPAAEGAGQGNSGSSNQGDTTPQNQGSNTPPPWQRDNAAQSVPGGTF